MVKVSEYRINFFIPERLESTLRCVLSFIVRSRRQEEIGPARFSMTRKKSA